MGIYDAIFRVFADFYTHEFVEKKSHVLVTTLYNLNLACQHIKWKGNVKYWKQIRNLKKLHSFSFIPYFVHLETFIAMSLRATSMSSWGVLKRGVPKSVRFCIGDLLMYIFLIPTHF